MRFMHLRTSSVAAVAALTCLAGLAEAKRRPPPPPTPPAPVAPTPPSAVADHVKAMKGTWKCAGMAFMPDGNSMPTAGTMVVKLDLDKFWAHTTFTSKAKGGYRFESYRTVDAASGKWFEVMVDNAGGQETNSSAGPTGNKLVWLGEARGLMGARKTRHTEELFGVELKLSGETSPDGKSWIKAYEASCRK